MPKTLYLILICFFQLFLSFSRQQKTDSLLLLLDKSEEDTNKVKLLAELARQFQYTGGDSKKYSEDAWHLSLKLDYTYGKALALYSLGRYNYYISDYNESLENNKQGYGYYRLVNDTNGMAYCLMSAGDASYSTDKFSDALQYYDSSIALFEKIHSEIGIANCLMSKGDVSYVQDNYEEALQNYKRALEYFEKNNSQLGIANCINCMADVLYDQEDYLQAGEKYQKAIGIFKELNDKLGLGNCTKRLGDIESRRGKYEKALVFYNEAYGYYSACGSINGLGNTIRNLGEIFMEQKNYPEAIKKMNEASVIFQKTGDGMGLADCYNNLAVINKALGHIQNAIQFAEKGFELANEIGTPEIIQVSAFELGELFAIEKKFDKAYYYQKLYTRLNDSINSNENVKKITRLQMQIDFEQKAREQQLLQKQKELEHEMELEQQKMVRNSFVAGFSVLLLLSFFIYRNYQNKKKANLLLEEKNLIIGLKNKEITDSIEYAQNIQKSMLISDQVMHEIFPEHFVLFKPRDIVSGDFYLAARLNGGDRVLAVADCTGHGVPGALMSMIGDTLLNKIVMVLRCF